MNCCSLWLASSLLLHCPHPKSPSWGNFGELVRIVHSSVTYTHTHIGKMKSAFCIISMLVLQK